MIFFALWGLFYLGFATSLLMQAQASASSTSNNLRGISDWLKLHWRVVWARLFLATVFSGMIFHLIPATSGLGEFGKYAAGGFIADSVLDKVLFIWGQQFGTKVEVPQLSPPTNPEVK